MDKKIMIPQPAFGKEIVFACGSWRDMGCLYARQAPGAVTVKIAAGMAAARKEMGGKEPAVQKLQEYLEILREKAPEIEELWQGIADGAGCEFEAVALAYTDFRGTQMRCSNLSAWGTATQDNNVCCGMNCDEKETVNYYAPAVAAYPKDGFAFISASAFTCNCVMNEHGLVLMASCGENARTEDTGAGLPNCVSLILCAASCRTTQEAKQKILKEKLGPGGGENIHIVDVTGDACVIEHTACGDAVRESEGRDYLLAANHFLTKEMQKANFTGKNYEYWMNSYFRYWSLEQVLKENYGRISLRTLDQALGKKEFYGKDLQVLSEKGWQVPSCVKEGWNSFWKDTSDQAGEITGKFSPEIRTPDSKCVFSALIAPQKREIFIMNGCRDTQMCLNPYGTGVYTKINLAGSVQGGVEQLKQEAALRIYEASRAQDSLGCEKRMKEAKLAYLEGIHLADLAVCHGGEEEELPFWSLAATAFSRVRQICLCGPQNVYGE